MKKRGLTNKQKAFVEAYLQKWNASEAARIAGYKTRANEAGRSAMSNPDIKAEIERRIQEKTMQADEVLARLTEQARGEHSKYIGLFGAVDIAGMIADGKTHLIKRIRHTKDSLDIEFYDSQSALALIGKHYAMFTDRVISDWREQARREGFDPDDVINELVKQFTAAMVEPSSSGSVADSDTTEKRQED